MASIDEAEETLGKLVGNGAVITDGEVCQELCGSFFVFF